MLSTLLALAGCDRSAPVPPLGGVGAAPVAAASAGQSVRLFYSGHSLMDRPLPDQVEALARADGITLGWDRQYRIGSLMRERTRGADPAAADWTGWMQGENREGQGLDVLATLTGQNPSVAPFDVLVTTERHDILWALTHESSAAYLRALHDARVRGRPQGATWFYEGWQSFGPGQVRAWAAYERAAAGAWQCVAAEVNRSLEQAGRPDRVWSLPASRALVDLVDAALSERGLPGITAETETATLARLFRDEVHLTDLGLHYMALVTWAFVADRPLAGPWRPDTVTEEQSASLRRVASQAHAALRGQTLVESAPADCQAQLTALCPVYWGYMEERQLAGGRSALGAAWDRAKQQWRCERALGAGRHRLGEPERSGA